MDLPELSCIEAFLAVAETGSFSAAARRLATPKSSVSRRVTALEESLSLALFHRTSRAVRLTPEGVTYRAAVADAVGAIRDASTHLREARLEPTGLVRWTAPAESWELGLGPIVERFTRAHPKVQVELELTNRYVDLLREEFDFALRAGSLPSSALMSRRVGSAERWLVASPAFLAGVDWHQGDALERLEQVHSIASGGSFREGRWLLRRGAERVQLQLQSVFRVNDHHVARDAAVAGLGVAFVPDFLARPAVTEGRLVRLFPEWTSEPSPLSLVFPVNPAPRARALMDFLAEWFHEGGAAVR